MGEPNSSNTIEGGGGDGFKKELQVNSPCSLQMGDRELESETAGTWGRRCPLLSKRKGRQDDNRAENCKD